MHTHASSPPSLEDLIIYINKLLENHLVSSRAQWSSKKVVDESTKNAISLLIHIDILFRELQTTMTVGKLSYSLDQIKEWGKMWSKIITDSSPFSAIIYEILKNPEGYLKTVHIPTTPSTSSTSTSSSKSEPHEQKEGKEEKKKDAPVSFSSVPTPTEIQTDEKKGDSSSVPGGPAVLSQEPLKLYLEHALRTVSDYINKAEQERMALVGEETKSSISRVSEEGVPIGPLVITGLDRDFLNIERELRTLQKAVGGWLRRNNQKKEISENTRRGLFEHLFELFGAKEKDDTALRIFEDFRKNPVELKLLREFLVTFNFDEKIIAPILATYSKEALEQKLIDIKASGVTGLNKKALIQDVVLLLILKEVLLKSNFLNAEIKTAINTRFNLTETLSILTGISSEDKVTLLKIKNDLDKKFNEIYDYFCVDSIVNALQFEERDLVVCNNIKRSLLQFNSQVNKLEKDCNEDIESKHRFTVKQDLDAMLNYLDVEYPSLQAEINDLFFKKEEFKNQCFTAYGQLLSEGFIGIHVPWTEEKVGFCQRVQANLNLRLPGKIVVLPPTISASASDIIKQCEKAPSDSPINHAGAFIHWSRGFSNPACYVRFADGSWCTTPFMLTTATKEQYEKFYNKYINNLSPGLAFFESPSATTEMKTLNREFKTQLDNYIYACIELVKNPGDRETQEKYNILATQLTAAGGVIYPTRLNEFNSVNDAIAETLSLSLTQWAYVHFNLVKEQWLKTNPRMEIFRKKISDSLRETFQNDLKGLISAPGPELRLGRYVKRSMFEHLTPTVNVNPSREPIGRRRFH